MSTVSVQEYSAKTPLIIPKLYSQTQHFHFMSGDGCLTHHSLPAGPAGYQVVAVKSTGHEVSVVEHDRIALTIPLSGLSQTWIEGHKIVAEPGDVLAIGPSRRSSKLSPDPASSHYRSLTIISPPWVTCRYIGQKNWMLRRRYRDLRALRNLLGLAFQITGEGRPISAAAVASLETLIEEMFWTAMTQENDCGVCQPRRDKSYEVVRKAREYMSENIAQPMSIPGIADSINVSVRALQAAFKSQYGRTPKQFLTQLRIEEMRKILLVPEEQTTVTSAQMDAGLFHLGRPSKFYKDRYGELPSTTLRRSRKTNYQVSTISEIDGAETV